MIRFIKSKAIKAHTFAVVGAGRGNGATHLALVIANYLSSVKRKNVTIIELNSKSDLYNVISENSNNNYENNFYKNVRYITSSSIKEANDVLSENKDYIVFDIHDVNRESMNLFMLCDKKFVIGSFKPWKRQEYIKFVKSIILKYDTKNVLFLGQGINTNEKKQFYELFGLKIFKLPIIWDPYCIEEKDFPKIEQLVSE